MTNSLTKEQLMGFLRNDPELRNEAARLIKEQSLILRSADDQPKATCNGTK